MMSKRFVYVLKNSGFPPRYYTGLTSDIATRYAEHNAGSCVHTAKYRPWSIDLIVEFADERRAVAFDRYLKSGSGAAFAQRICDSLRNGMNERERRSRELQEKIGRILYEDWDPLGLRSVVPLECRTRLSDT